MGNNDDFNSQVTRLFQTRLNAAADDAERAGIIREINIAKEAGHISHADAERLTAKENAEKKQDADERTAWENELKALCDAAKTSAKRVEELKGSLKEEKERTKELEERIKELISKGSDGYFTTRLF